MTIFRGEQKEKPDPTREPIKHKIQNRFTTLNIGPVPVHRSKSGFTMKKNRERTRLYFI
ncbi:hypothetical protein Hanom_Chr02g00165921 [Helianthus anomalus]